MGREHSGRGPAGISQLKRETRAHVGSPRHFATPRYPPRLGAALENERTRTGECTSVSLDGAHVFFFFYSGRSGRAQPGALRTTFLAALRRGREQSRTAPHRTACAPRGRPAPPAALRHRHGPERGEKLRSGSPAGSSPCRSAGLTSISVTSNLSSGTRTAALRPLAGVSFGSVLPIPTRHKTLWQAECELHHQRLQQELAQ